MITFDVVCFRSNESLTVYRDADDEAINLPDPPMIEVRSSKRDMRLNSQNDLYDDDSTIGSVVLSRPRVFCSALDHPTTPIAPGSQGHNVLIHVASRLNRYSPGSYDEVSEVSVPSDGWNKTAGSVTRKDARPTIKITNINSNM